MLSDNDSVAVPQIRSAVMGNQDIDFEDKQNILGELDIEIPGDKSFTITIEITVSAYDSYGGEIGEDEVQSAIGGEVDRVTASDLDVESYSMDEMTVDEA